MLFLFFTGIPLGYDFTCYLYRSKLQFEVTCLEMLQIYGIKNRDSKSWGFKCRYHPQCLFVIQLWMVDLSSAREGLFEEQYRFEIKITDNMRLTYKPYHDQETFNRIIHENAMTLEDSLLELVNQFKLNKIEVAKKNKVGRRAKKQ